MCDSKSRSLWWWARGRVCNISSRSLLWPQMTSATLRRFSVVDCCLSFHWGGDKNKWVINCWRENVLLFRPKGIVKNQTLKLAEDRVLMVSGCWKQQASCVGVTGTMLSSLRKFLSPFVRFVRLRSPSSPHCPALGACSSVCFHSGPTRLLLVSASVSLGWAPEASRGSAPHPPRHHLLPAWLSGHTFAEGTLLSAVVWALQSGGAGFEKLQWQVSADPLSLWPCPSLGTWVV